jgi:hypothetical protein
MHPAEGRALLRTHGANGVAKTCQAGEARGHELRAITTAHAVQCGGHLRASRALHTRRMSVPNTSCPTTRGTWLRSSKARVAFPLKRAKERGRGSECGKTHAHNMTHGIQHTTCSMQHTAGHVARARQHRSDCVAGLGAAPTQYHQWSESPGLQGQRPAKRLACGLANDDGVRC